MNYYLHAEFNLNDNVPDALLLLLLPVDELLLAVAMGSKELLMALRAACLTAEEMWDSCLVGPPEAGAATGLSFTGEVEDIFTLSEAGGCCFCC